MCLLSLCIAGSDYSGRQNVPLRFTSTNTEQMVFIPIIDDADIEDVERFMGRLSINSALFPSVTLNPQTANVDIISDDGNTLLFVFLLVFEGLKVNVCSQNTSNLFRVFFGCV